MFPLTAESYIITPSPISTRQNDINRARQQEDYQDLGADYFEKRNQDAFVRQTVRKLENLGFMQA
ncbi:hypothetical protein FE784_22835 [Paenibacillus hemerocallicola]|uniref:Uncharacterized protein n=1 Tax=Paenibacillus hemerocallicola TaxID=1172614 RepID=A0A5C4T4L9_9BACL|nr:hypothetical protein FE784_22835 [Paenibacillus hemerocallicola]